MYRKTKTIFKNKKKTRDQLQQLKDAGHEGVGGGGLGEGKRKKERQGFHWDADVTRMAARAMSESSRPRKTEDPLSQSE